MVTLDPNRVALQLYTVRGPLQADFLGTLQAVADAGYRAVEFAGFGPYSAAGLRGELDRLGLRVAGAHVPLAQWEARPDGVIADLQTIGSPYGVVPFVPEDQRGGLSEARRLAENLNRWGALCREQGLGFAYHHHNFEFDVLPGTADLTLFQEIVTQTDPANVGIEIDVYWAARGGQEPLALLRRLAGRVPLVHFKDLGPAPDFADLPVGAGTLPWDRLIPAAEAAGARWFIVEQDHPADPIADAAAALRTLTT
ncbi:MAG TPA: sugar phosphate isomerase/epimerase [Thermomicrobiales bacterium]|nr:sugar phosphate isomerase/epimerase [Thermomicrobiales bacterium]